MLWHGIEMENLINSDKRHPNFIIVGAPKAGTTTLFSLICSHPDVFPASIKETHFFNNTAQYHKGIEYYFSKFFKNSESYLCKGEATPAYLRNSRIVIPRMQKDLNFDKIKFIFLLRDPVQRAWSHYLHRKRSLNEDLSFQDALKAEKKRLAQGEEFSGYFNCGLYGEQCSKWLSYIPKGNSIFIKQEDLFHNEKDVLSGIFKFLEIDPNTNIKKNKSLNKAGNPKFPTLMKMINNPDTLGKKLFKKFLPLEVRREIKTRVRQWNVSPFSKDQKPEIDKSVEKELRAKYLTDIIILEKLTGWDCSNWKSDE